jgi:hypothetical protein
LQHLPHTTSFARNVLRLNCCQRRDRLREMQCQDFRVACAPTPTRLELMTYASDGKAHPQLIVRPEWLALDERRS